MTDPRIAPLRAAGEDRAADLLAALDTGQPSPPVAASAQSTPQAAAVREGQDRELGRILSESSGRGAHRTSAP